MWFDGFVLPVDVMHDVLSFSIPETTLVTSFGSSVTSLLQPGRTVVSSFSPSHVCISIQSIRKAHLLVIGCQW